MAQSLAQAQAAGLVGRCRLTPGLTRLEPILTLA